MLSVIPAAFVGGAENEGENAMKPGVHKSSFGKMQDGTEVDLYTLINNNGLICKITTYGGIITELHVPDKDGKLGDIVLGFDNLDGYLKGHPYFGALIGRVGNRIAKGKFTLEGKTYTLATNNGPNHLHGGIKGFDKVVWKGEIEPSQLGPSIKLTYTSADGEEGYPGELYVIVIYTLTEKNELRIDYMAKSTKATPVNLTNHSYYNLAGVGDILNHVVTFKADHYTPVDATLIPTGEIAKVVKTPMDFRKPHTIGERIRQIKSDPVGYDHNFVLNSQGKSLALAARVEEPKTGRIMEISTTEPGVQFYSGNFLDGSLTGKRGVVYKQYYGFCMETQHFPDSANQPKFPSTILFPNEPYNSTTIHKFTVKKD